MSDSDGDYVQNGSSGDERDHNVDGDLIEGSGGAEGGRGGRVASGGGGGGGGGARGAASRSSHSARRHDNGRMRGGSGRGRTRERWEGALHERTAVDQLVYDDTFEDLAKMLEARKRARLRQDTQPFQRGIIRHLVLVLDLSEAMLEKDMRPNRYVVMLLNAQDYVREFFEQNPISQLSILAMHDGVCIKVSDMSGNPDDHISAIQALRVGRGSREGPKEPAGSPSLQNALEMSRAVLYHTPNHGTREVLIILGALLTLDPGDIHNTIVACVRDRLLVNIIGILARLKICQEIVSRTNAGDESGYSVATDQIHFRQLLMMTTTPPVIRSTETSTEANTASLLPMGFPSRMEEDHASLCTCHAKLTKGGYLCPRCRSKVCNLPVSCPVCDLTLILSTHLARSYHHLFPLKNWMEVLWTRAQEMASVQCKGCMKSFPAIPDSIEQNGEADDRSPSKVTAARFQGASESARYECTNCHHHFCVDCDLFAHQTLHNCPGCLSGPPARPAPLKGRRKGKLPMYEANGMDSGDAMDLDDG